MVTIMRKNTIAKLCLRTLITVVFCFISPKQVLSHFTFPVVFDQSNQAYFVTRTPTYGTNHICNHADHSDHYGPCYILEYAGFDRIQMLHYYKLLPIPKGRSVREARERWTCANATGMLAYRVVALGIDCGRYGYDMESIRMQAEPMLRLRDRKAEPPTPLQ